MCDDLIGIGITGATLLIEVGDVFPLAVVELLEAQSVGIEVFKQGVDALLHIDVGQCLRLILLLGDQRCDATFKRLQALPTPGFKQMPTTLQTFLTFENGSCAAQLLQRVTQGKSLKFTRFEQGGEPRHQRTVLKQKLISEQTGQIEVCQVLAAVLTATDGLQPAGADVCFLQIGESCPEQPVMLQREIF